MGFSNRLRELRLKNNLTQGYLAKVLDLKPTAISNYEADRNEPSFDKLILLAKFFNVSCDYLLGLTDSYLPMRREDLDNDLFELYNMYKQLSPDNVRQAKDFIQYLLYKEENNN